MFILHTFITAISMCYFQLLFDVVFVNYLPLYKINQINQPVHH